MNTNYAKQAKILIKSEMAKQDVDYPKLVELLSQIGVDETRENLSNKINRGTFSAIFLFQFMKALKIHTINLNNIGTNDE